jgi:hypothetical protein
MFQKQSGNHNLRVAALIPSLLVFCVANSFSQETGFSQENAYAILKTLVLEMGPRPMGSPAERRALDFAVSKFKEYGCDSSYVMRMTVAEGVNTNSGIAVGVKRGRTNRIIVIGGHIDSSGPDVPGANDDASGTACVIELARVLCKRENESTVYFCCWGGEEQGLQGSKYFVQRFAELDSVALMLQIDMADGAGELNADPDGSTSSAPSWLVASTFDVFYNDLHSDGLIYPTEDATLNLASGGTWGSDHIPFIDKGIPAIDFTSDPTYPIHSPQDSWENFTPSGLKRSGDLVLKLFEKYDGGVPSRTTERYQLLQFGSRVLFVQYALLWVFIAVACAGAIVAFVLARKKRLVIDPALKVRWSRFKILSAALVIQTFVWSSETIVGAIKGYRFPWVNNVRAFQILALLSGLVGLWLVLRAARRYRLSEDAYVFARSSLVSFLILTIAASLVTPELGMYLAGGLLCVSLAVMVRQPLLKLLFFVAAFVIVYNLLFFDGIVLFQRLISENQISKGWQKILLHAACVVLFAGLSLPFMHGFAAVYRGSGVDLLWLKRFRNNKGVIAISLAMVAVVVYLLTQPVYGKLWYSNLRVEQQYRVGGDTSSVVIRGSEYLSGVSGRIGGRDTLFDERSNFASLNGARDYKVSWLSVAAGNVLSSRSSDSTWNVERNLEVHSRIRPLRVNLWYDSNEPFDVSSEWTHGARSADPRLRETDRRKVFRWYSFPDTLLTIPVTFTLRDTQRVIENVEVIFDSVEYPINLQREFTNVSYRTVVTVIDSFSVRQ